MSVVDPLRLRYDRKLPRSTQPTLAREPRTIPKSQKVPASASFSLFGKIGLFVLLTVIFGGCGASVPGQRTPINVFAAASLTDAFTALGSAFEAQHPDVQVTFNFAGSQQLAQQMAQGAPADIFASADEAQMGQAVTTGRISPDAPRIFAHNSLIVVLPGDNPGDILALADLARPGLRLVLADASVPVGAYSRTFLAQADAWPDLPATFSAQVLANTVSFEVNVRAVLSKVRLGEADAGIVYRSDVVGAAIADEVITLAIPDGLNVAAAYPIAELTDAVHPGPAADFVAFVLSPMGQQILAEYGLSPGADHEQ